MSKVGCGLLVVAAVLAASLAPGPAAAERQTIGYLENVHVYPGAIALRAKIDSGALTSSLDVSDPVEFARNGKPWLRFTVTNDAGQSQTLELPVARLANVRRSGTATQQRYVVKLSICLGATFEETEVNLTDRAGMGYKILIGRRFLAGKFLIDAAAEYLTKPECPEARAK